MRVKGQRAAAAAACGGHLQGGGGCGPMRLQPKAGVVVEAVESLYTDGLLPLGRILLKRIREIVAAHTIKGPVPLIDPDYLRRVCEGCPKLRVELVDKREYTVLLVGRSAHFVDPCNLEDPYPAWVWDAAADYFGRLDFEAGRLPGGRYDCAKELLARRVQFLTGRSVGEVCHIVQLAISPRKLLGYDDGNLVPYAWSKELTKAICASQQRVAPRAPGADAALRIATWADVCEGVQVLLNATRGPLPVSNLKRLFQTHFCVELSETALGHAKICELFHDVRLHAVCRAVYVDNCQVALERVPAAGDRSPGAVSRFPPGTGSPALRSPGGAGPRPLLCLSDHLQGLGRTCASDRLVSAARTPCLSTQPSSGALSAMDPKAATTTPRSSTTCADIDSIGTPSSGGDQRLPEYVIAGYEKADEGPDSEPAWLPPKLVANGFIVRNTFIDAPAGVLEAARKRSQSLPKDSPCSPSSSSKWC